ncbi:hypothetical protein C1646_669970 [Rhizophagus diaphanus]|nr:hypothetical protein C1646_669970 [Rhizophagus diaphanus] [Rhizophagus sp. MUCL 43196]
MASPSKSKHVVIDWDTSTEKNSFVQLGSTPMPQEYSYVQNIKPEVLLSTKDVLFTDIDNILPLSFYTAPHPCRKNFPFLVSFKKFYVTKIYNSGYNKIYNSRRSKSFFFEIVNRNPNTNDTHLKIHTNDYLMSTTPFCYNSTSRVPNAKFQISKALQHFFSSQRVIPCRIQKKYFDMLRKKLLDRIMFIESCANKNGDCNHSTNTFFNFSYKKYRFHFGIYVPCNHNTETNSSLAPTPCQLPSPIMLLNK